MNLREIRLGLAAIINGIEGLRVTPKMPNSPQWGSHTWVIVAPDEPYVTYSEGAGFTNRNEILMRLICLPLPGMGAERVQDELDDLLSCGASEPRSLRSILSTDLSLGGTACTVSVLSASIKTYDIGGVDAGGAEVSLKITARC